MNRLDFVQCKNVGTALDLLRQARARGLRASYHPHGGDTAACHVPVSHVVWVEGKPKAVRKFCAEHTPRAVVAPVHPGA
jgi:hypothetical protein